MKIKRLFFVIALSGLFFLLFACGHKSAYKGNSKVVFELEGAVYKNSSKPVTYYYDVEKGESVKIVSLQTIGGTKDTLALAGYRFEGWYKTKTVTDDKVTYSDKWDFSSDKLSYEENLTLYANWKKISLFKFNVCYKDLNGEAVVLGTYEVEENESFSDYLDYANKRTGYTPKARLSSSGQVKVNYYTESNELIEGDYVHPGSIDESNLEVNIYVDYLRGSYKYVASYNDLSRYAKNYNIYLLNDIDCAGGKLSFGDYTHSIIGNGHKIKNCVVNYDATRTGLKTDLEDSNRNSLYISLFGDMKDASISDVSFENIKVVVQTTLSTIYKIYVAPLCIKAANCTVSGVTISGSYEVTKLPTNFDEANLIFVTDRPSFVEEEDAIEATLDITINEGE